MMMSATDLVEAVDSERFDQADARRLAQLAGARRTEGQRKAFRGSVMISTLLDARVWSGRPAQAIKAYWWVPAGFAVLVLLRTMGG